MTTSLVRYAGHTSVAFVDMYEIAQSVAVCLPGTVAGQAPARHAQSGHCRRLGPQNWIFTCSRMPPGSRDCSRAGRLDELLPHLAGLRVPYLDVEALVRPPRGCPMCDCDPLPWWGCRRVSLIGDAAHPCTRWTPTVLPRRSWTRAAWPACSPSGPPRRHCGPMSGCGCPDHRGGAQQPPGGRRPSLAPLPPTSTSGARHLSGADLRAAHRHPRAAVQHPGPSSAPVNHSVVISSGTAIAPPGEDCLSRTSPARDGRSCHREVDVGHVVAPARWPARRHPARCGTRLVRGAYRGRGRVRPVRRLQRRSGGAGCAPGDLASGAVAWRARCRARGMPLVAAELVVG